MIELDGEQVLTREMRASLSQVVIVNPRLRNGEVVYPFGQFGVDDLAVTLPGCDP